MGLKHKGLITKVRAILISPLGDKYKIKLVLNTKCKLFKDKEKYWVVLWQNFP
jgi:hypothetical protein